MMKKLLCTSIAGLLIGSALPAFAESTVELKVAGLIVPVACRPSLSANTVDVGRISVKDLNQETRTELTPASLVMNVNCDNPTLYALTATDNQADSGDGIIEFGIGKTSVGQRIGGYLMFLDQAIADGSSVRLIQSANNGASWNTYWPDNGWQTNRWISIQEIGTERVPVPAKDTQMTLSIKPFILPAKNVTVTEDTRFHGVATVTIKYL